MSKTYTQHLSASPRHARNCAGFGYEVPSGFICSCEQRRPTKARTEAQPARFAWGFTREQTRRMVRSYVAVKPGDEQLVEQIVNHCMAFGEGVWHATAAVLGRSSCWCSVCKPGLTVRA